MILAYFIINIVLVLKRSSIIDTIGKFLTPALIIILVVVIAYILELCNNFNFLSYELGMIVGGFAVILEYSVID